MCQGRRFHAPQPQALPVGDGGPGAVLYREHDVGLPGLTPGADPGSLACSSRASGCVLEDVTEDHAEIRVRRPGARRQIQLHIQFHARPGGLGQIVIALLMVDRFVSNVKIPRKK